MHPPKIQDRAISLYVSGLSARGVTEKLLKEHRVYVSPQTVARWVRELGKKRPVGERRSLELGPDAKRLYESGLNLDEVARRCGVGRSTVAKRLREMGVVIRPSGSRFVHILDEERLRALYLVHRWSAGRIAKETACSVGTVYRLLRHFGIRRPPPPRDLT